MSPKGRSEALHRSLDKRVVFGDVPLDVVALDRIVDRKLDKHAGEVAR